MYIKQCKCGFAITTKSLRPSSTWKGKRAARGNIGELEYLIFNCVCGSSVCLIDKKKFQKHKEKKDGVEKVLDGRDRVD